MNTKQPQSEGIRRIVLACSVVLAVLPVFWMLGALIGNLGGLSYTEIAYCILVGVIGSIVFFLIPRAIAKIAYWIIDGFREDRNR
ncbi:MAG: hypothetical protein OXT74_01610 [Candidatus Poribacteria bacterium]|nr:hypothetical protein [Candidatus Poribacteria bacterium]